MFVGFRAAHFLIVRSDTYRLLDLSRATLVRIARERVQDGCGVGVGRCGRDELSAGYADGDVAEGSQGADEFADADPGGLLQVAGDGQGGEHDHELLDEWERLSKGPIGAIIDVALGSDERSVELRQNSPFAGALSNQERLDAIARAAS